MTETLNSCPHGVDYSEILACPQCMTALLEKRATTHGDFSENALIAQTLRDIFRGSAGWGLCNRRQREALDMIACKISRILSGNPNHPDHWDDIAGYAKLAKQETPK